MRTEFDEERDVVTTVITDKPIVRTEEVTHQGQRSIVSFDAEGQIVRIEMFEASKVRTDASKIERISYPADAADWTVVSEFSWVLALPGADSTEEFTVRAPLSSYSIDTLSSPQSNQHIILFPIGGGFELGLAYSEPTASLPTGFSFTPRRLEGHTFSWEWFNWNGGTQYEKIQEDGAVEIERRTVDGKELIVGTKFLRDISLRFKDDWSKDINGPFGRVLIEAGTMLRWPVLIGERVTLLD